MIGGAAPGEGNLFGINSQNIDLRLPAGQPLSTIQGNTFGLEADGETKAANTSIDSVVFDTQSPVIFGGSNPGEGNAVAFANGTAVNPYNTGPITIRGNTIGLTKSGKPAPTTWTGIGCWGTLSNVVIGGDSPADGNTIAYSSHYGIEFAGTVTNGIIKHNTIYQNGSGPNTGGSGGGVMISDNSTSNTIRQNTIYNNKGSYNLGIDLGGNGPTQNSQPQSTTGANHYQNYPIIENSITRCDSSTAVKPGGFNSTPNTTFTIDYYANPSWDPASNTPRQGEQWVSSETVTTDANGDATLTIPNITYPSVTATAPDGSTSEFGSINNMQFSDCQDMNQRTIADSSKNLQLYASWTGSNIPATYYRNQPQWPADYNQTTGQWTDHVETGGLTFSVTVGGQPLIYDTPQIWNNAYYLDNNGWQATGHTATPLPEGTYDVVLTVTDPSSSLSMTKTYKDAVKVALPKITYTTTITNNQTPTLTGTAADVNWLYNAYIVPVGTIIDPANPPKNRAMRYTQDQDGNGNQLATGSWKVMTNKQDYITLITQEFAAQQAHDQASFAPNWAGNFWGINGVDTSTIKTLTDLKAICSNTDVQQRIRDWWGDTITSEADCQAWFQQRYDQIAADYASQLQNAIADADTSYDFTPLPEGKYDVYILGTDYSYNGFTKSLPGGLIIDLTGPTATLVTDKGAVSPELHGTVDDPSAKVEVTINGHTYTAVNNGNGTWILGAGIIAPLTPGNYTVIITVTDMAGNVSTSGKVLSITDSKKASAEDLARTGTNELLIAVSGVILTVASALFMLWRVVRRRGSYYYSSAR